MSEILAALLESTEDPIPTIEQREITLNNETISNPSQQNDANLMLTIPLSRSDSHSTWSSCTISIEHASVHAAPIPASSNAVICSNSYSTWSSCTVSIEHASIHSAHPTSSSNEIIRLDATQATPEANMQSTRLKADAVIKHHIQAVTWLSSQLADTRFYITLESSHLMLQSLYKFSIHRLRQITKVLDQALTGGSSIILAFRLAWLRQLLRKNYTGRLLNTSIERIEQYHDKLIIANSKTCQNPRKSPSTARELHIFSLTLRSFCLWDDQLKLRNQIQSQFLSILSIKTSASRPSNSHNRDAAQPENIAELSSMSEQPTEIEAQPNQDPSSRIRQETEQTDAKDTSGTSIH